MNKIWTNILKPRGWMAKWLLFIFMGGFIALSATGHFEIIKQYTDTPATSIKLGEYEVSLYKAMKSIIVIIFVFWAAAVLSDIAEGRLNKLKRLRAANRALFLKIIQIAIYFVSFLFTLDILGIDLTALTVFSGALGIGLGFGLQKISSNFISGIILLLEKSVEQGDLVEMTDGTFGFVRKANARFTLLETVDGREILIPNEDFITSRVINWTYSNTKGRIEIPIGVSYASDIEKARDLILEAANAHPLSIDKPEPVCFLRTFGDSSVDFILHFWVADITTGRWAPQSEVMFDIWNKFKKHNIEIPYPQRDLHLKSSDISLSMAETKAKTPKKDKKNAK